MTDLDLDAKPLQQQPATAAEDDLLQQSALCSRRVQRGGDRTIPGRIHRIVRVEEVQHEPTDPNLPDSDEERTSGQVHREPDASAVLIGDGRDGQAGGIVVGKGLELRSVRSEHLAEVPLLVEQPDADERYAEIAGALEMIAGENAQAPGVDRQPFAQAELHREVGNAARSGSPEGRGEPARPFQVSLPVVEPRLQFTAKCFVGGSRLQPLLRRVQQHQKGIARALPRVGVDSRPETPREPAADPPKIERQLLKLRGQLAADPLVHRFAPVDLTASHTGSAARPSMVQIASYYRQIAWPRRRSLP